MQLKRWLMAGVCILSSAATVRARAQSLELAPRTTVLLEPSSSSKLIVINPSGAASFSSANGEIELHAGYEADIVSGATESLKGGRLSPVDIVSSATEFEDTRQQFSGGFMLGRNGTKISASYSRGIESDYRSHAISASASTSFLQKNTELSIAYGRGFDQVCTTAFSASDSPSVKTPLDSSEGCFKNGENRASRKVDLDNFQSAWTQTWSPVFTTQFVAYAALQHGFLENPYRAVVIAPAGDDALENHPDNRLRLAGAVHGKYYLKPLRSALTLGTRIYRDTWDILGQTYELEAERYMLANLRLLVRARYYRQTEALFWSDDYTGGEPSDGPRGQYWTGDRELSPLQSYLLGGRIVFRRDGSPRQRIAKIMLSFETSISFDIFKTHLDEFTWGGKKPDDTLGMIWSIGVRAGF